MITILLTISGILYLTLQLEDKLKIPSPLGLIALSFATHHGFQGVLTGGTEHFAALGYLPAANLRDSKPLLGSLDKAETAPGSRIHAHKAYCSQKHHEALIENGRYAALHKW